MGDLVYPTGTAKKLQASLEILNKVNISKENKGTIRDFRFSI
jgi:hypothetical protein